MAIHAGVKNTLRFCFLATCTRRVAIRSYSTSFVASALVWSKRRMKERRREKKKERKKEKAATSTSDCGNDEEEVNFTGYKANITRRYLRYTLPRRQSRTMGQKNFTACWFVTVVSLNWDILCTKSCWSEDNDDLVESRLLTDYWTLIKFNLIFFLSFFFYEGLKIL